MSLFEGTISDAADGLAWILRICPQFALGNGFMNMSFMSLFGFFDDENYTPLDMRITGNSLVYMAVFTIVYLVLLLWVERWAFLYLQYSRRCRLRFACVALLLWMSTFCACCVVLCCRL